MPPNVPKSYTPTELARRVGMTPQWVSLHAKHITGYHPVNGRPRFDAQAVEAAIKARQDIVYTARQAQQLR